MEDEQRRDLGVTLLENVDAPPMSEEWIAEIRRRAEDVRAGGDRGRPWEEVKADLQARVAEIRASTGRPESVWLTVEHQQEADGAWTAEIAELPPLKVSAPTRLKALADIQVLAMRRIADRIEEGAIAPSSLTISLSRG